MSKSRHPEIRQLLRNNPDGLTSLEISENLGVLPDSAYNALRNMPDTYVDRWTNARQSQPAEAVWCAIVPPEDCPRPTTKTTKRKEMNGHAEFRSLVQ